MSEVVVKPWPCKTCRHLRGPDGTGTLWCAAPVIVPLFVRWGHPWSDDPHHRYIGTQKQIDGLTKNVVRNCQTFEPAP
jgi:hypothetical protein